MSTVTAAGRDEVLAALDTQIGWCRALASPFTAGLLGLARDNVARGGALADVIVPWSGRPLADNLALRLAGAYHFLVRAGRVPALAAFYPPAAPPWDAAGAADAGRSTIAAALDAATVAERAAIAAFIRLPPQTNEVGRSAILMPGYAAVARTTGLPLRVLELGASAGVNLAWNHYAYRLGPLLLGAPDSALVLAPEWRGPLPPITRLPDVAEVRGCDQAPIDLERPEAAERLVAYFWPDQPERIARLEAAIRVVRAARLQVDEADAADWLDAQLSRAAPGVATIVAHTIVWQYFPRATAERARRTIEGTGARATTDRPLAWLAFEHRAQDAPPELTLTTWPGGVRRRLGRAHPHGTWIDWEA